LGLLAEQQQCGQTKLDLREIIAILLRVVTRMKLN
jgi:hypothetical protein